MTLTVPEQICADGSRLGDTAKMSTECLNALANAVTVRRLSNTGKPAHLLESQRQSLLHRKHQLISTAASEFTKVLRDLGSNLNDSEISTLFDYFHLSSNVLRYADFASSAKSILTPRRKAIERIFKKFDNRGDGIVLLQDVCTHTQVQPNL